MLSGDFPVDTIHSKERDAPTLLRAHQGVVNLPSAASPCSRRLVLGKGRDLTEPLWKEMGIFPPSTGQERGRVPVPSKPSKKGSMTNTYPEWGSLQEGEAPLFAQLDFWQADTSLS